MPVCLRFFSAPSSLLAVLGLSSMALLALLSSVPLALAAETGKSFAAGAVQLETIVVTGRRSAQPRAELSSNSAQLGSAELSLLAPTHIAAALGRVAGANFARGSGQEYLPALRSPVLSGAGACGSVLSAQDGIALRAAGFCNVNELFDAHTEVAQRIEVLRGPAQVAFGSNAVHGVVNMISRSAASTPGSSLRLEAGSDDFYRLHIGGAASLKQQQLRADLTLAQQRGFRDSAGYDQQKLTLHHAIAQANVDTATVVSAANLDQQTASFLVGSNAYRDRSLRETNADPDAFRKAGSVRLQHRREYSLAGDRRFIITPYARHAEMDFSMHFLPGEPTESNGQSSVGLQSQLQWRQGNAWFVQSGVDLEYTEAYLRQTQQQPTQGSAFLVATIPQGKQYDYRVSAGQLSAFIDAQRRLGQRWQLAAGLRYEHMAYDYDNRMLDGRTDANGVPCGFGGCRYSRPADRRDRFNNWSPFVGVLYQIDKQHQLYANASHGFRAPQATELYRLQREQTSAELDAEAMFGIELGARSKTAALGYEVNAFAYKKDDVIFRDADFFNVSGGQTTHRGLELTLDYTPRNDWLLGLRASYARHRYDNRRFSGGVNISGKDIDSAPRHFGNLYVRKYFQDHTQLELEWVHQSRYYTDPQNQHRYPGHDYLNLHGQWQPADSWRVGLRVINLTDVLYADRADFTSFSGDRYFPAAPRSFFIDLNYSWD